MTTKDEALRMALEALNAMTYAFMDTEGNHGAMEQAAHEVANKAITAIREALASGANEQPRLLSEAPCDQCGYNGPGYYQPSVHPCAAKHHKAQQQCMEHGECFGGECIYPAPQPAQQQEPNENAALLAANRDLQVHFDVLMADYKKLSQLCTNQGIRLMENEDDLAQPEQEVDWEKLYRLEVKKKEALAAKYERDIKPLTKIVPMAQPEQEPQRWSVFCAGCHKEWSVPYQHPGKSVCAECESKLKAQPSQEPVAYMVKAHGMLQRLSRRADVADELACKYREDDPNAEVLPLYTSPPPRKPENK